MRQSRQDLHVKLEDHYGTVTGANFQALAQLLEQVIYHSSFINEACKKSFQDCYATPPIRLIAGD